METALQEAIKKLQQESRAVFGEFMKDDSTKENELASESNGLLTAVRICKALLPKEREQMKKARENGFVNGVSHERHNYVIQDFEQYYENNFNTNKV